MIENNIIEDENDISDEKQKVIMVIKKSTTNKRTSRTPIKKGRLTKFRIEMKKSVKRLKKYGW